MELTERTIVKNTKKPYDVAVFIGRFQPVHIGHEAILKRCAELADNVIILVGSSTASRSVRNPFTFRERLDMLNTAVEALDPTDEVQWYVRGIPDSAYNFHDWLTRAKSTVNEVLNHLTTGDLPKVTIVGHYKDDTSYLNFFPGWDLTLMTAQKGGVSSTQVRQTLFATNYLPDGREGVQNLPLLSPAVKTWVLNWMETSPSFKQLADESFYVLNYKASWAKAPFPPTFVTTDAVVIALGHVLVIKRGRNPGKGLYALPGGFLNQTESIQQGCIRELREETKIDVTTRILEKSIKDKNVFDNPYRDPRGRTITHAFLLVLDLPVLPKVEAADDAASVEWIALNEIQDKEDCFFGDHAQITRYFAHRLP
jgi:bifunctional NMN adenylyltransferase/nudix hydrolase